MAEERERSGGKTDYVWGRHDKHRNMINSTQPHPEPSAHRLPSIASTLRFNPCRDHLPNLPVSPFRSLAAAKRSVPSPLSYRRQSFWKKRKKERKSADTLLPPTPGGKLATRLWTGLWGGGRGTDDVFFNQRLQSAFVFVGAARDRIKGQTKDGRDEARGEGALNQLCGSTFLRGYPVAGL